MRSSDPSVSSPVHGNATSMFASRGGAGSTVQRRGTWVLPALSGTLALSVAWAGVTTYYLAFHDDWLSGLLTQQRAMQIGYEDRVGSLQRQIDRDASERVLTRTGLEKRLAMLAERQALIEKRQGIVAGLGGTVESLPAPQTSEPGATGSVTKPFPTPDLPEFRMRGSDQSALPEAVLGVKLSRLEARLEEALAQQSSALNRIAARAQNRAERYRSVILRAGLSPARFEKVVSGMGGPLVPLSGDPFEFSLLEARRATELETRMKRTVRALPFRKPLTEEASFTSGFGARLDPFTRGLALHTGIDFRADFGAAARATAPGRVVSADYAGGYGNMVEVDHGHGVMTRYAHLAAFSVVPGQRVEAGSIVGRVGSTGRSTGNHLHYETRIDGEPVDPQTFLRGAQALSLDDEGQSISSTASPPP